MTGPAVLALTAAAVLAVDQAIKSLVHHVDALTVVEGRLWAHRAVNRRPNALWPWLIPVVTLAAVTAWMPSSSAFAGLMIGGSLSNLVEASLRGSVTDYVRLRFWPAFNIADVALTVGAIGMVVELVRTLGGISG